VPDFARGTEDGTDLFRGESALSRPLRGGDGLFEPGEVEAIRIIEPLYLRVALKLAWGLRCSVGRVSLGI